MRFSHALIRFVASAIVALLVSPVVAFGQEAAPSTTSTKVLTVAPSKTPVLVGPEGVRFWTTLENAQTLLKCKPIPATTKEFSGQVWRGQTASGERVISVEEQDASGKKGEPVTVARPDGGYSTVPGENFAVLFYQVPVEGAPWIGKGDPAGNYHLKTASGAFVQIGLEDDRYRTIAGAQQVMTRGLGTGEYLTGEGDHKVFSLVNGEIVQVGECSYRSVKPAALPAPPVPILMSRGLSKGAKWVGEYGGKLYIQK